MKIRADIADLLRQGMTDRAIARQLHCDAKTVARARRSLHIQPAKPGPPATPLEKLLADRTRPADGGHLEWTGSRTSQGVPTVRWGGKERSAYRLSFLIRYGREPKGYVRPGCDHKGCIHPAHVEDRVMRQRTEATFTAIFGEVAR